MCCLHYLHTNCWCRARARRDDGYMSTCPKVPITSHPCFLFIKKRLPYFSENSVYYPYKYQFHPKVYKIWITHKITPQTIYPTPVIMGIIRALCPIFKTQVHQKPQKDQNAYPQESASALCWRLSRGIVLSCLPS